MLLVTSHGAPDIMGVTEDPSLLFPVNKLLWSDLRRRYRPSCSCQYPHPRRRIRRLVVGRRCHVLSHQHELVPADHTADGRDVLVPGRGSSSTRLPHWSNPPASWGSVPPFPVVRSRWAESRRVLTAVVVGQRGGHQGGEGHRAHGRDTGHLSAHRPLALVRDAVAVAVLARAQGDIAGIGHAVPLAVLGHDRC